MAIPSVKIDNWVVKVVARSHGVSMLKDGVEKKFITCKQFENKGLMLFPAVLRKRIQTDLTCANTFDRFIDKYYLWSDDDDEQEDFDEQ